MLTSLSETSNKTNKKNLFYCFCFIIHHKIHSTFLAKICVFENRISIFYKLIRYYNFNIVEFPIEFSFEW